MSIIRYVKRQTCQNNQKILIKTSKRCGIQEFSIIFDLWLPWLFKKIINKHKNIVSCSPLFNPFKLI